MEKIRYHIYYWLLIINAYIFLSFPLCFIWFNIIKLQPFLESLENTFIFWLFLTVSVGQSLCILSISTFIMSLITMGLKYFLLKKPLIKKLEEEKRKIYKATKEAVNNFQRELHERESKRHDNPRTFSINN